MNGVGHSDNGEDGQSSDEGDVFLDEDDVIQEILVDEEELPERIDEVDLDVEYEEADDSFYVFEGHKDEVYAVACSPIDTSLVASGGKDDKGFLWVVGSAGALLELQGHGDTVSSVAFSYDGKFLASGSYDGVVQVWDTSLLSLKCRFESSGQGIEWLKWHPKGHLILAGSEDCSVWLWNVDKSILLNTFYGHASSVTCGDFTPDGKIICTGSDDASLWIWNPRTGESIHTVRGHPYHTDGLTCLSITSDSAIAITGSKDGSVHMVNLATGRVISSLASHADSVESVGISPSSSWAATGSLDTKLIIWDLQRSSLRCICEHEDGVTCLLWLGTTRFVASGSVDGKVRLWDSLSGACVRIFGGHVDVIQALAVSADLRSLVSVSTDCTSRVFDISSLR
ncbi:hypothetical protein HPP92_008098 [Vanilla planifolia]|uniref:Angio-associated migratory cell protein n=1 Tax=Vanilla planifolia TaxID=51239 RepID=A0A835RNQ6_VANPL|nr:hypothetical protein HPP92_008098 [Vanilla planifolia]